MDNPFKIIYDLLQQVITLLLELKQSLQSTQSVVSAGERLGGIELAQKVTGKSTSTIYNLCSKGKLPHFKRSGKLYFSEAQLRAWIQQGQRTTVDEISRQVEEYLGQPRPKAWRPRKKREPG